jgi:hypothetical protein
MKFIKWIMILAISNSAMAQTGQVRGGVNLSNVTVTADGRVDQSSQLRAFQIGILGDFKIAGPLYLQTGVLYTGKGALVEHGIKGTDGYFRQNFNPYYLEVPATLLFKTPPKGFRFYAGAGPYLGIGIAGKVKTEGQLAGVEYSYERSVKYSSDDPSTFTQEEGTGLGVVKRFDYGVNAVAGVEGASMTLGITYGLGLAKLQSGANSSEDDSNKYKTWQFTIGFKF